ncbi:O-antigen ligase family protein [Vibrio aphrogenes]|uniref:O-antigen ligase family protein n=1 Tax=Vibrio aphrogenes TaxID=1891186 RepID=UPI000B35353C|nr:O-antigen ligase family protein [Vibrio aphrogenes]
MYLYIKKYSYKLLTVFIYLPFIWLGTGLCLTNDGRSIMTRLMVVASISLLLLYRKKAWSWKYKTRQQLYTSIAMLAFVFYLVLLQIYHGADRGLIRTIGLITLYYYLFPLHRFNERWVITAILFNALGLAYLIYQNTYLTNINRLVVDAQLMNPIPFATYCMLAAITQVHYAIKVSSIYLKGLCLIASVISITGMLLTDTRGVALALIFIALMILIKLLISRSKSFITLSILAFTILSVFIGTILKDTFVTRYNQTQSEIHQIQNGNLNTSIGLRFQIWNSGIQTLMDYPILGIGSKNFRPEFKKHYEQGLITKNVVRFNPMHYHNQFLDMAVKNGVMGLILFSSIFGVFLLNQKKFTLFSLSSIYIFSIFICGLTDVPFSHLSVIYFFMPLFLFTKDIHSSTNAHNELSIAINR